MQRMNSSFGVQMYAASVCMRYMGAQQLTFTTPRSTSTQHTHTHTSCNCDRVCDLCTTTIHTGDMYTYIYAYYLSECVCVSADTYVYDALEFVKVEERQIIKSTEQILLACSFIFPSGNYIYIYTLYVLHGFFFFSLYHSLSLFLSFSFVVLCLLLCCVCVFLFVLLRNACSLIKHILSVRAFCKSHAEHTQKIFIANISQKEENVPNKKRQQRIYISKNVNQQHAATTK